MSEFQLNNTAECLGYLCLFVAMNDGELDDSEVEQVMKAMYATMKSLEIDADGDGDVDVDDLKVSFNNVWENMPNKGDDAAKYFLGIVGGYFKEHFNKDGQQVVLNNLADVARADGEVKDIEKQNVNLVAEIFELEKPF